MAQPGVVQLKRKRTDEPVEVLVLQGATSDANGYHYKRQRQQTEGENAQKDSEIPNPLQNTSLPTSERRESTERRIFELQRKPLTNLRKRKDASSEDDIATFVEKKQRRTHTLPTHTEQNAPADQEPNNNLPTTPLKRPGKSSTLRTPTNLPQAETDAERKQMEALAAYMHSAALETLNPSPQPKVAPTATRPAAVSTPKLSGARSQQLHRQRAATNSSISSGMGMEVDDEDSYVYDTYILAPSTDSGALALSESSPDAEATLLPGSVGYLVINEDDRGLWEMYLEEEGASEKDWDSEADDENAEGWFGAEYPDEEEFSGSEEDGYGGFGTGRRGMPDDEEYYGDLGGYSSEDDVIRGGVVPRRLRRFEVGVEGR